jgi:hypothetical protein
VATEMVNLNKVATETKSCRNSSFMAVGHNVVADSQKINGDFQFLADEVIPKFGKNDSKLSLDDKIFMESLGT